MRRRQREAVAAEILDAAEAVIADEGLEGASIAAIAARAGVAVGTLYNYFPDRAGVVEALFRARRDALAPAIRAAFDAATGPFEERLGRFLRGVLGEMDAHRRFVQVAVGTDQRPPATGPRRGRQAVLETLLDCLTELLRVGAAEGVIDDDDLVFEARLLAASLRGVILHQLDRGEPFAAAADRLGRRFLDGVRRR